MSYSHRNRYACSNRYIHLLTEAIWLHKYFWKLSSRVILALPKLRAWPTTLLPAKHKCSELSTQMNVWWSGRCILLYPHTICFWLLPAALLPIKSPNSSEPVLRQLRSNLKPKGTELFMHNKWHKHFPSNVQPEDNSHQPSCQPCLKTFDSEDSSVNSYLLSVLLYA